jgi:hypothetical protein
VRVTPLALLFAGLAAGLALIGVAALEGGSPLVGLAALALAVWMATLAWRALR